MIKQLSIAAALAIFAGVATAQPTGPGIPGYVVSYDGSIVRSGQGGCVHSGFWTPADAVEPCDRVARAEAPAAVFLEVEVEEEVVAITAPVAEPAPAPRSVIEKLTIGTELLFAFNKAELTDAGKAKLDKLAVLIKDADVDAIVTIGYADRIASEGYNQKLSEQRAQAVKDYLVQNGAKANVITAEGKGESDPVTGDACWRMGPERGSNRKLVACLQPDRRVDIEVLGSRQVAVEEAPAAAGAGQ